MIPENVLTKLRYRDYWEKPYVLWRDADAWNRYFLKKHPEATVHMSHDALASELETLIKDLKRGTEERKKAQSIRSELKNSTKRKQKQNDKENLPKKNSKSAIREQKLRDQITELQKKISPAY
ncbi:25800_t:CDS:2, partial [Racocetra persica]